MKTEIIENTLTDGSLVYDLLLTTDDGAILEFSCIDEKHAKLLQMRADACLSVFVVHAKA